MDWKLCPPVLPPHRIVLWALMVNVALLRAGVFGSEKSHWWWDILLSNISQEKKDREIVSHAEESVWRNEKERRTSKELRESPHCWSSKSGGMCAVLYGCTVHKLTLKVPTKVYGSYVEPEGRNSQRILLI